MKDQEPPTVDPTLSYLAADFSKMITSKDTKAPDPDEYNVVCLGVIFVYYSISTEAL